MTLTFRPFLGMWRNRQTRRSQKPLRVTLCGFDSHHPHQERGSGVSGQGLLIKTSPEPPTPKPHYEEARNKLRFNPKLRSLADQPENLPQMRLRRLYKTTQAH